ncbi:MAG: alpha/beta fold hydrolase [Solirubrobacteraceae bacterium]
MNGAPAQSAGLDWRTFRWDEVRWRAELPTGAVEGVEIPGPDGPPLVLIHGLGGQWQHWLATLLPLARHRRVIALDLPGCGRSDPISGAATVEQYAARVMALARTREIDRAVLVGHSFGGCVATAVAAAEPDLATHLVLASVPALRRGPLATVAPLLLRGLAAGATRPGFAFDRFVSRPRIRRAILAPAVADRGDVTADLAHLGYLAAPMGSLAEIPQAALAFAGGGFARCAARVRCPATVLWGERDRIVPVDDAEVVGCMLRAGPVVRLPGTGHLVMAERPERFCEAVIARALATGAR